jgi:O-methyltransferase
MKPSENTYRDAYLDLLKRCLTASLYDESSWTLKRPNLRKKGLRRTAKALTLKALDRRSLAVVKRKPFNHAMREGGEDSPLFGFTMVGHRRLDNVQHCIERILVERIPGDLLEAGVWRGGVGIFMRAVLKAHGVTDRKVWLADSFAGMPKPRLEADRADERYDLSGDQYLNVSLERVQDHFERFGLLDDQVRFLKGWFGESLPQAPVSRLALLRLDCDLYESTMDVLTSLYHRVSPGGYVIADDYHSWPPCREAITEFLAKKGVEPKLHVIDRHAVYWQV